MVSVRQDPQEPDIMSSRTAEQTSQEAGHLMVFPLLSMLEVEGGLQMR